MVGCFGGVETDEPVRRIDVLFCLLFVESEGQRRLQVVVNIDLDY